MSGRLAGRRCFVTAAGQGIGRAAAVAMAAEGAAVVATDLDAHKVGELGARGITVNAIAPGFTLTEASYGHMADADSYGVDRGALRRASEPDDIVGAALFFAGPESAFISGQTLVVDGGRQFI